MFICWQNSSGFHSELNQNSKTSENVNMLHRNNNCDGSHQHIPWTGRRGKLKNWPCLVTYRPPVKDKKTFCGLACERQRKGGKEGFLMIHQLPLWWFTSNLRLSCHQGFWSQINFIQCALKVWLVGCRWTLINLGWFQVPASIKSSWNLHLWKNEKGNSIWTWAMPTQGSPLDLGYPWRTLATLGDMLENNQFPPKWSFSSMSETAKMNHWNWFQCPKPSWGTPTMV